MGAPPKITEERIKIICESIEAGNWIATAARMAGITARTVRNWLKHGREHAARFPEEAAFVMRYDAALGEAENQLVTAVRNAAAVDARHAQWLLEKRFPQRWKRPEVARIDVTMQAREMTDEELYSRATAILAARAGNTSGGGSKGEQ